MVMNSKDSYTILFIGIFLGYFVSMLSNAYININFESVYSRLQKFEMVCKTLNSTPKSFDNFSVTCDNGLIIEIDKIQEHFEGE